MIGKRLSHVPTLASINIRYEKTFGHKLRDAISACGHHLHPVKKYIFPNFLAVHYFYIIMVTIIASILLYPVKNARYIDILFLATGASTQGGLNTINTNDLSLYQQIIVYITCIFSTPIAIHGCLAFVRLYWFERYFDGIRDSSKKNFRMRRTKTILGREMTARTMFRDPTRTATRKTLTLPTSAATRDDFQEKLFSGQMLYRDEEDSNHDDHDPQDGKHKDKSVVDSNGSSWSSSNTVKDNNTGITSARGLVIKEPGNKELHRPRERFAGRRRSTEISPEDMYRSITMMQGQHKEEEDDDGPALVVGAPIERPRSGGDAQTGKTGRVKPYIKTSKEAGRPYNKIVEESEDSNESQSDKPDTTDGDAESQDSVDSRRSRNRPPPSPRNSSNFMTNGRGLKFESGTKGQENEIANNEGRMGPSIQFDVSAQPRRESMKTRVSEGNIGARPHSYISKDKSGKGLFKHLSKGKGLRQKIKRRLSTSSVDKSIKGGQDNYDENYQNNDKDNIEEYFADNESDDEDQNHPTKENGHPLDQTLSYDPTSKPTHTFSNAMERSRTFDMSQAKELDKLAQSPDFQNMIYKNWKKRHRKEKKQKLLRATSWNNKIFDNERSQGFPWNQDHTDMVDGESEEDEGHQDKNAGTAKNGTLFASEEDNETESRQNDELANRGSLDEEQGYYGLDIDPDYAVANSRPPLSRTMSTNYLSWQPTIGRNSTFVGLTRSQKEELGGVEYTSIKLLCRILVIYYFGFLIMSFVMLLPWILSKSEYKTLVRSDGVSPTWWGFFTSMSAFTDLGLTLTPDSMNSFQTAIYPLITMMWFIVIGNTGFPVLLRFIIWILSKIAPELSQTKENLEFLLDHPRRCFTLLFPRGATWWLLATLIGLNATDLILFIILDFGSAVVSSLSSGFKVLDGLFQAISTRTAGFTVVDLSLLHPSIQVSYMLMMYVSVLPLAISIRRTNVYEEQSLGLYGELDQEEENSNTTNDAGSNDETSSHNDSRDGKKNKKKQPTNQSFIGAHLRKQLSYDIWFLFLGLFIICICEGGKIKDPSKPLFNVFSVLFEIVSAYGTVGLSLGYPNTDTSFSAQFTTLSKLVIIAMLIRGRNRGLPYALDRAIILPSERLDKMDDIEDLKLKRGMTEERSDTDPVTAYFKKKTSQLRKGFRKLQGAADEPEEHLLHSYKKHNNNSDYNLQEEERSSDHDPLESASHAHNIASSSIDSQPSNNYPYNHESAAELETDDEEDPMSTVPPVSLQQNYTR